jgi:hypothetical protein
VKLTIESPDGERIVRYGVGDFQTNGDGTVTLFYPPETVREADAPNEEQIDGRVTGGVDSRFDTDDAYYAEDLEMERDRADDLIDYRLIRAEGLDE